MNDFFFSLITHPGFPIVTALVGFLVGNHLAIGRDKQKEFRTASERFILSFQNTLAELRYNTKKTVGDIINPDILNHEKAYVLFRQHLGWISLKRCDCAWRKYFTHNPHPGETVSGPEHHYSEWENGDERTDVIKKIEKILRFAKFKKHYK